jgi:hypothetical protein
MVIKETFFYTALRQYSIVVDTLRQNLLFVGFDVGINAGLVSLVENEFPCCPAVKTLFLV